MKFPRKQGQSHKVLRILVFFFVRVVFDSSMKTVSNLTHYEQMFPRHDYKSICEKCFYNGVFIKPSFRMELKKCIDINASFGGDHPDQELREFELTTFSYRTTTVITF